MEKGNVKKVMYEKKSQREKSLKIRHGFDRMVWKTSIENKTRKGPELIKKKKFKEMNI